ncbi:MAG: hypothetical protein HY010_07130 [Acidobacteria bacterium]|nr:hypothetical protein [Acidobacteriota bacterium]
MTVPGSSANSQPPRLQRQRTYRGIRILAWDGDVLYACRGYEIVRLRSNGQDWETVARFHPAWWRHVTSQTNLTYRLVRDGFHAVVVLRDGTMIGAVPGGIVTCKGQSGNFAVTHRIVRGTRPLHIAATPSGKLFWGEYFDNRERAEVHIYASDDQGETWEVAYTFASGSVRHVHNVVYDRWADCLWILTGDEGAECKVLRASSDLRSIETVLEGNQQTRAVAAIPTEGALYLATDTPSESNHVYRFDRSGKIDRVGDLNSSSIYGCRVADAIFFSTMVEPSAVNTDRKVQIAGAREGSDWHTLAQWKKDNLPMRYFQYGNAILPDGENSTRILAATTIAVEDGDLTTTLWDVE